MRRKRTDGILASAADIKVNSYHRSVNAEEIKQMLKKHRKTLSSVNLDLLLAKCLTIALNCVFLLLKQDKAVKNDSFFAPLSTVNCDFPSGVAHSKKHCDST